MDLVYCDPFADRDRKSGTAAERSKGIPHFRFVFDLDWRTSKGKIIDLVRSDLRDASCG